jgi:hypothetical protein
MNFKECEMDKMQVLCLYVSMALKVLVVFYIKNIFSCCDATQLCKSVSKFRTKDGNIHCPSHQNSKSVFINIDTHIIKKKKRLASDNASLNDRSHVQCKHIKVWCSHT